MLGLTRFQLICLLMVVLYVVFATPSAFAGSPAVAGINVPPSQMVLNKSSKLNKGFSVGTLNFYCGPKTGATMSQKEARLLVSLDTKRPEELRIGSKVCQVFLSKKA